MHFFESHIGDTLRDTAPLSMEERGAYHILEHAYYDLEGPLPKDHRALFRTCRVRKKGEQAVLLRVISELFLETSEGFVHERFQRRIDSYKALCEARKNWGASGGKAKAKAKHDDGSGLAHASQEPSKSMASLVNQKPETNTQEPLPTKPAANGAAVPAVPPAVEFPLGFPDTAERAVAWVRGGGHIVQRDDPWIVEMWNKAVGRGFKDGAGVKISSWPHYIAQLASKPESSFRESGSQNAAQKKEGAAPAVEKVPWETPPAAWREVLRLEMGADFPIPEAWLDLPEANRRELFTRARQLEHEPADEWRGHLMRLCEDQEQPTDDVAEVPWDKVPLQMRHAILLRLS